MSIWLLSLTPFPFIGPKLFWTAQIILVEYQSFWTSPICFGQVQIILDRWGHFFKNIVVSALKSCITLIMNFKKELSPAEWSLYSCTLSLILGFSIPFPLCVVEQLVQLVHVPEQRVKVRTQYSNSIIILQY